MKKLMLIALAIFGLAAMNAEAYRGYGRCYDRCEKSCAPKVCKTKCCVPCQKCPPPVRVIEGQKPAPKCCVRYVRVEEPCQWTKHIDWSCECPSTCQEEYGTSAYASEVAYVDPAIQGITYSDSSTNVGAAY